MSKSTKISTPSIDAESADHTHSSDYSHVSGESETDDGENKFLIEYYDTLLTDLTDDEFMEVINKSVQMKQYTEMENFIFQEFLQTNDPNLLSGLPQVHTKILELQQVSPMNLRGFEFVIEPVNTYTKIFSDFGQKVNFSQRTDLVSRCIEEMECKLNEFLKDSKKRKFCIKAALEESRMRLEEVNNLIQSFEEYMTNAVDPIAQRIPAEKFIAWFKEHLKAAWQQREKIRMRNSYLKNEYQKFKQIHDKKAEMGTWITISDFEQLRISNNFLTRRLDYVITHVQELKIFNGKANLQVSKIKQYLMKLTGTEKAIQSKTKKSEDSAAEMRKQIEKEKEFLTLAKKARQKVIDLITKCKAPSITDYLLVHAKRDELLKEKKLLARQEHMHNIIKNTTFASIKNTLGMKYIPEKWYLSTEEGGADELDEETDSLCNVDESVGDFDIFSVFNHEKGRHSIQWQLMED